MVEKYLSLPLFLSFLPFLYLVQSVPFCTKAGGLVMMRGIIYTNLINIIFPSSFIFLLSPSTVCCLHAPRRPQLSSLPNIHLSKVSTCWCAIKNWPSVSCFNRAAFLCHASPIKPQRAKNIPLGCFFFFLSFFLENLREWHTLTNATPLNFQPCVNLILLLHITKQPQAGTDWLNECYPFKISIQGSSYYKCFNYGVVYKREKKRG